MSALPKAFLQLDWRNWKLVEEPSRTPLMKREFKDADDGLNFITIAPSGWFEIVNVDGEIAWSAKFPSARAAHRAAMAIIEGMAR